VKIVRTITDIRTLVQEYHHGGMTIGLVPTMGALHEGHLSLLARSHARMGATIMSIFVNPTQFAPTEDFNKYPRPFDADCAMAEAAGCDVVFAPDPSDMYPEFYSTYVTVDALSHQLCGITRPDHFKGVATVVLKLFNIVQPQIAFFGAKDAQQVIVLKRMVRDLNVPVEIRVCPTVREASGLAMSSRNKYLDAEQRAQAVILYHALQAASAAVNRKSISAARLKADLKEFTQKFLYWIRRSPLTGTKFNLKHIMEVYDSPAFRMAPGCQRPYRAPYW